MGSQKRHNHKTMDQNQLIVGGLSLLILGTIIFLSVFLYNKSLEKKVESGELLSGENDLQEGEQWQEVEQRDAHGNVVRDEHGNVKTQKIKVKTNPNPTVTESSDCCGCSPCFCVCFWITTCACTVGSTLGIIEFCTRGNDDEGEEDGPSDDNKKVDITEICALFCDYEKYDPDAVAYAMPTEKIEKLLADFDKLIENIDQVKELKVENVEKFKSITK